VRRSSREPPSAMLSALVPRGTGTCDEIRRAE
jgi:hypothetical protein